MLLARYSDELKNFNQTLIKYSFKISTNEFCWFHSQMPAPLSTLTIWYVTAAPWYGSVRPKPEFCNSGPDPSRGNSLPMQTGNRRRKGRNCRISKFAIRSIRVARQSWSVPYIKQTTDISMFSWSRCVPPAHFEQTVPLWNYILRHVIRRQQKVHLQEAISNVIRSSVKS